MRGVHGPGGPIRGEEYRVPLVEKTPIKKSFFSWLASKFSCIVFPLGSFFACFKNKKFNQLNPNEVNQVSVESIKGYNPPTIKKNLSDRIMEAIGDKINGIGGPEVQKQMINEAINNKKTLKEIYLIEACKIVQEAGLDDKDLIKDFLSHITGLDLPSGNYTNSDILILSKLIVGPTESLNEEESKLMEEINESSPPLDKLRVCGFALKKGLNSKELIALFSKIFDGSELRNINAIGKLIRCRLFFEVELKNIKENIDSNGLNKKELEELEKDMIKCLNRAFAAEILINPSTNQLFLDALNNPLPSEISQKLCNPSVEDVKGIIKKSKNLISRNIFEIDSKSHSKDKLEVCSLALDILNSAELINLFNKMFDYRPILKDLKGDLDKLIYYRILFEKELDNISGYEKETFRLVINKCLKKAFQNIKPCKDQILEELNSRDLGRAAKPIRRFVETYGEELGMHYIDVVRLFSKQPDLHGILNIDLLKQIIILAEKTISVEITKPEEKIVVEIMESGPVQILSKTKDEKKE